MATGCRCGWARCKTIVKEHMSASYDSWVEMFYQVSLLLDRQWCSGYGVGLVISNSAVRFPAVEVTFFNMHICIMYVCP